MRPPRPYRRTVHAVLRLFPYWHFVGVRAGRAYFKPSPGHTKTAHRRSAWRSPAAKESGIKVAQAMSNVCRPERWR